MLDGISRIRVFNPKPFVITEADLNEQLFSLLRQEDVPPEDVERLLDAGADKDARTSYAGNTPLMLAAIYAHPQAVELLRQRGADESAKNRDSRTALELAYREKNRERDHIGFTPLWKRYRQVVTLLAYK